MSPILSPKTVGVIGSGRHSYDALAEDVGRLLAELHVNLLTGGGGGVMEAVSRAFTRARPGPGICIGIIPCTEDDPARPPAGYPNPFVELAIYTHLPYSGERGHDPLSRNHINVLSCAAIVALPGEHGTASEVSLARRYNKPVIIYSPDGDRVRHFRKEATRATTLADVKRFLQQHLQRGA